MSLWIEWSQITTTGWHQIHTQRKYIFADRKQLGYKLSTYLELRYRELHLCVISKCWKGFSQRYCKCFLVPKHIVTQYLQMITVKEAITRSVQKYEDRLRDNSNIQKKNLNSQPTRWRLKDIHHFRMISRIGMLKMGYRRIRIKTNYISPRSWSVASIWIILSNKKVTNHN